jgi:hypothetical protein
VSRAAVTAGQRAQVKVPGQRTREAALDTFPPANGAAAVNPMGGGAARKGARPGLGPVQSLGTGLLVVEDTRQWRVPVHATAI